MTTPVVGTVGTDPGPVGAGPAPAPAPAGPGSGAGQGVAAARQVDAPRVVPGAARAVYRAHLLPAALVVAAWSVTLVVTAAVPDVREYAARGAWLVVLAAVVVVVVGWALVGLRVPRAGQRLRYWSWWYVAVALWFLVWEVTTAKTGRLVEPHFAPPEALLADAWEDRTLLWSSFWASTRLLLVGFAVGALSGFFTGLAMGWSKVAHYWIHPVLQSIGPVPAGTLLPLVFVILPTPHLGSVFMIAFGVWFPVAVLTRAGIASVARGYFDVAQTLGASSRFLVWRVAIPGALPSIFTGLFMGLGASLGALALAELLGVKSGLGWYIQWVKGWADYPKMYVAILIMVLFCRTLIVVLFRIRNRVLSWEKDLVRW